MIKTTKNSLLAVLLALTMLFTVACQGRTSPGPQESQSSASSSETSSAKGFINPMDVPDGPGQQPNQLPVYSEKVKEKYAINKDSIGWLSIPGTSINDVVMWYPGDTNIFYLRKNFDKNASREGSYFADFRSKWGESRKDLSKNIIIYGHSMEDDPNAPLFSQLKKYWDEDFAKNNPYIYFSTEKEDMVWQIFAVYYSSTDYPYNTPDPDDATYAQLIKNAQESSLYIYDDVEVTTSDNILALSTCCYNIVSTYPNKYRYVVMAKLLDENAVIKETVNLSKNPSPKMP